MRNGVISRVIAAGLLTCAFAGTAAVKANEETIGNQTVSAADKAKSVHFDEYLDRLMMAESAGRAAAANPRSTAVGHFQFIESTFIELARRHFPEYAKLGEKELLALRTDPEVARRAAAIYSMESLAYLTAQGFNPTYGDLRLAHLVGPVAAARVMRADPKTPAKLVLGGKVVRVNPFMKKMSASQLMARSAHEVGERRISVAIETAPEPPNKPVTSQAAPRRLSPEAKVEAEATCNRQLATCRRWIALQANKERVAAEKASKGAKAASRRAARPGV